MDRSLEMIDRSLEPSKGVRRIWQQFTPTRSAQMGLIWGLRISQDSTDVIGDTSWHGPKMALHAVQVKPVCTNIFPCWRCVSKKNLTRIQIIPNASPVQLSILTPQNYISYFGDLGTPREQLHPSIEGSSNPLCLWVG